MSNIKLTVLELGLARNVYDYPIFDKDSRFKVYDRCMHPNHNPPMYISLPKGTSHKHTCPSCGTVQIIRTPDVWMK
jgi:predicted RNA-binding Zn-ribbon protein involved in translation (DUF1610 family)